jgi:hypothetical protein
MLAKDNRDASKEKEFLMELGIIGHVFHPNTANLLGCCIENGLYLIFNFSQNGNLASALHGNKLLHFLLNNSRMLLKKGLKNAGIKEMLVVAKHVLIKFYSNRIALEISEYRNRS